MINSIGSIAGASAILMVVLLMSSFGSIATYIIIVVANRADPDPSGKRPMAVYLFGGAFLTLWIAFIGAVTIVSSLVGLIGTNYARSYNEQHPVGDGAVRGISIGLLFVIIAGLMHLRHRRRGLELAESETDAASPTKRIARSYVAVVSFISILIVVLSSFATLYTLLGLIAPGIYQASSRMTSFRAVLIEVFVLILSSIIFHNHQRLAPNSLRLYARRAPVMTVDVVEVIEES